ncbi:MAG: isoprenylcysteine carboxylmethyltransferase family protein [bacterium]
MLLVEKMELTGRWLFRWRSYLPLFMAIPVFAGLNQFTYPFGSHYYDQIWDLFCLTIAFVGLMVRIITVGYAPICTSGRNTKEQVADTLNTTGMYSIVRNPLYFGNFLVGLGVSLFLRVWWIPCIYLFVFILYYERIILAEEAFLREKFGQKYTSWAEQTPVFIPHFRQWSKPAIPFNFRKACRREYQTLSGIVAVFYSLELMGEYRVSHTLMADRMWNVIALGAIIIFVTTRFVHRYTDILN